MSCQNKTMLLGVDSLDATRGLVQKFLAVEEMFEMQPGLADKVNFVQVCFTGPHSRERMVLEAQVQGFVARVNSKLGSIDEAGPVQFFLNINPNELSALYAIADVLVITPIRDGMDVVPFEYVVSRECRRLPATVVLSEFAGCARSIGGAVLINPWNTTEFTEQMIGAINMEENEREIRQARCRCLSSFMYSRWRLVAFNLEGVLARACALPELVHIPAETAAWLDSLSREPKNMVVVKSPRSRDTLDRLLGRTNCVLAAEHGAFIRWGKHARWQVSHFLEIVVTRFRRLLKSKPSEDCLHLHGHNFEQDDEGHGERFSSVIAGVDLGDADGYYSGVSRSHSPETTRQ
ncbi:unnamed protein product [Ectocarpus fasciculatus]